MNDRRQAAAFLLSQGLPLTPLRPNTKWPKSADWQNGAGAIRDPSDLNGQDYGALIGNGLVGIDIDVKNVDGIANFDRLLNGFELPKTLKTRTASGGMHLYFRLPEGSAFQGPIKLDRLGIEVYTSGRQFCAIKDGYDIELNPIAQAPAILLSKLDSLRSQKGQSAGRNDTLSRKAFALRKNGASIEEIESALLQLNEERFANDPLPEVEVIAIACKKERVPADLHQNDLGNAKRLALAVSNKFRHIADLDIDMVWSPEGWVKDRDATLHNAFKTTIQEMLAEAITLDTKQGVPLLRHAKNSGNAARIKAAVDLARLESPIRTLSDQWDADGDLITFSDGTVLNIRTMESRPMDRSDLIRRRIDAPFNLQAKCPEFDYLIDHLVGGDKDARRWLLQLWSTGLVSSILQKVILVVHGTSDSGKTTTVEIVKRVLGDFAVSPPSDFIIKPKYQNAGGPNAEIINLLGKRAAFISEFPAGRLDDNKLKGLTGSDTMTVRRLYSNDFVNVPCRLTITISSNPKPFFDATDSGMNNRVRALHVRDPLNFAKKPKRTNAVEWILAGESAGIAALLVRSLRELIENGEELPRSSRIDTDTAALVLANDRVGMFIEECCRCGPGLESSKRSLYVHYVDFCKAEGHQPFSARRFHEVIREVHHFAEKKVKGERRYAGIEESTL